MKSKKQNRKSGGQQVALHAEIDSQNNSTPVHWSLVTCVQVQLLCITNNMGGRLSNVIEHSSNSNGDDRCIQIGTANPPVSVKVYQDIYHQVTGRTEQIRQRYSDNLLIEFSELEQLHHKIMQLCDIHNIVASNEVISVFHDKERKEQFTSFERFRAYNSNATSPSVNVVLKYNFSIIPSGIQLPQEYVVTIRLTSRVATINQMENEAPEFMRGRFLNYLVENTAEVTIDYADYVIARGFLEAFDEWIRGCRTTQKNKLLALVRPWSHLVPRLMRTAVVLLLGIFSVQAIPGFFGTTLNAEMGARFFVIYISAAYILVSFASAAGNLIEESIDTYPSLSYLKLNRGDTKLIEEFGSRKNKVLLKFFGGVLLSIILGIISSKLEKLI